MALAYIPVVVIDIYMLGSSSQTVRKPFLFSSSVTSTRTHRITLMKVEITQKCSSGS